MNKLTDRLQLIAEQINKGETMADIGTDHGFLPLYLWKQGISPRVIMCDISEPSLAKAREAARKLELQVSQEQGIEAQLLQAQVLSALEFRAGDGLKVLGEAEVDSVVIAGMGGALIRDILAEQPEKTHSFKKFVFQPRNNCGVLRHWLVKSGFEITKNLLVREGKFICEIIVAITNAGSESCAATGAEEGSASWSFPAEMIQEPLGPEYARVKLEIEKKIESGILLGNSVDEQSLSETRDRIRYYESLILL